MGGSILVGSGSRRALPPAALVVLALASLALPAPTTAVAASAASALPVAVSILPQADLVERIGGERVRVVVAVAPGESPSSYDPTPRQLTEIAGARLYLALGVPMENHLLPRLRAGFPEIEIVDTAAGIAHRTLEEHDHGDRAHEGHGGHDDDGNAELDPHVWLDPGLMQVLARHAAEALARHDPDHAGDYRSACAAYVAELDSLDRELAALLEPVRGRELFVFHPAFGYLADAYGLRQVAIEQGGLDPSPKHLAAVLDRVRAAGARAIFVQPQFSTGSARSVAREAGVSLVVLDPLARDYAANMRAMARAIREGLE
jgi:zinc transport system substrate-binding protein